MKRIFEQLVLAGLMAVVIMAGITQTAAAGKIRAGAKAGAGFATLTSGELQAFDWRLGLSGGAFVNIPLTHGLSIQPELTYAQKGAKQTTFCNGTWTEFTAKLDYVEAPVLLVMALTDQGNITPRVFAGPALAFKVSFKEEASNQFGSSTVEFKGLHSSEFCLIIGMGMDFRVGFGILSLEGRLTPSLRTIRQAIPDLDQKNVNVSLLIGFSPSSR